MFPAGALYAHYYRRYRSRRPRSSEAIRETWCQGMAIVPTGRSSAKPSAISTPWKSWNSAWGAPYGQGRALKTTPPPTTLSPFNSLIRSLPSCASPLPLFPLLLANGRPRYLSVLPTLLIPWSKELDKWNEKEKGKKKILLPDVSSGDFDVVRFKV